MCCVFFHVRCVLRWVIPSRGNRRTTATARCYANPEPPRGCPGLNVGSAEWCDPTHHSTARASPCPNPEPSPDVSTPAVDHEGQAGSLCHLHGACSVTRSSPVGPVQAPSEDPQRSGRLPAQSAAQLQSGRDGGIGTGLPDYVQNGPAPMIPGSGRGVSITRCCKLVGLMVAMVTLTMVAFPTSGLTQIFSSSSFSFLSPFLMLIFSG